MNPKQLAKSIDALLNGCPGIRVPPIHCGEKTGDVTALGIAFPSDCTTPAAKIYFSPQGGQPSFPTEMPEALRDSMKRTIQNHGDGFGRLYDASVECAEDGGVVGRLLWALRSCDRADGMRWSGIVRGLLADLGHPGLAEPLLRLDEHLREILRSELAPLYQLGGFLAPDGSLFRIKANFDADVSSSAELVEYDRDRAMDATRFLLRECGLKDDDVVRMLFQLDAAMQGACQFYSWGFHAEGKRLESLKIYVRDNRPTEIAFPAIFKAFYPEMSDVTTDPSHRPDVLLFPFGWRYHGFYVKLAESSLQTLKFYFRAPMPQMGDNDAQEKHSGPSRTLADQ